MVMVKVSSLASTEVDGETGIRVDLVSTTPRVISTPGGAQDDLSVAQNVIQGLVTGLQQVGLMPKPGQPRMILFLTSKEYSSLGEPQINDIIDLVFENSRITFKKVAGMATSS
jgi:hypothetical protein